MIKKVLSGIGICIPIFTPTAIFALETCGENTPQPGVEVKVDEKCGYETSFEGSLKNVIQISKVFRDGYIGNIQTCPSQLYYTYRNRDNTKFDITSQKDFVFASQVDNLDELKEFKEIKIEYVQR